MTVKKYKTIYADPPWYETGGGKIRRGADRHYPLMKTKEIKAMRWMVRDLSSENAHLYLWTTNNYLRDALEVMEAWGFTYKTMITWNKRVMDGNDPDNPFWLTKGNMGLGQYFRGCTEHLLFGVRGSLPYKVGEDGKRQQGITSFFVIKDKHSKKPEYARKLIEKVSYPPYIELFAREEHEGWDVWGEEVTGERFNGR